MKRLAICLFAAAALVAGCGSDDATFFPNNNFQANNNNNNNNNPNVPPVSLRQIEQLARPGINEALLFTNEFLNTYNAVSPQFVANALANPNSPEGVAAGPIFTQASTVLTLIINFGNAAGPFKTAGAAVAAFLPDVMRVNSDLNIAANATAYNLVNLNAVGSPIAGRKLTDDVIDVTYQALLGPGATDRVNYAPNANNPATGHNPPAATFPYLAPAN